MGIRMKRTREEVEADEKKFRKRRKGETMVDFFVGGSGEEEVKAGETNPAVILNRITFKPISSAVSVVKRVCLISSLPCN